MKVPAVITAGDRGAARAIYGQSKVYLEIEGRPLVAWVVDALQRVPEVSEVWVVGDAERLEDVFARDHVKAGLQKPLHILSQFRNLYENCWETYRRVLPGAPVDGRDPEGPDLDFQVLYISGDLPFATPQEISDFIQRGQAMRCEYALGLVDEESVAGFLPAAKADAAIPVAFFNMREGRLKQSNLHLAKPARMDNRHYIQDMYEHRHQREFANMVGLAWRLLRSEQGGLAVVYYYLIMHFAGLSDRWGWRAGADRLRRWVSVSRIEVALAKLLKTDFRFAITHVGGCAIDVDTEQEYDTIRDSFPEWRKAQQARAEVLHGPLPLPATATPGTSRPED